MAPADLKSCAPAGGDASTAEHLIIAFAGCDSPQAAAVVQALSAQPTSALRPLLGALQVTARSYGEADSLSPPHERALAQALGWPALADGLLPWAAHEAASLGLHARGPWGQISLCHWAMGREQASLSDPALLSISDKESQALMADMAPFFAADGIELHPLRPGVWLAQGEPMALPTASLARVIGRDVDPWLPAGPEGRLLRRLQGEMQMLLYTHPVNEARATRRELPINSLWFSGTGQLPAQAQPGPSVHLSQELAGPAMAGDWAAYAQAWQSLDAQLLRPLLARLDPGMPLRLTLCGERGSLSFEPAARSLMAGLRRLWRRPVWPPKEGL